MTEDASAAKTATVLIVDDESTILELSGRVLEAAGYEVLTASSGTSAMNVVREHKGSIDVVLMDVILPGIEGSQLAGQLARIRPEVRVIFASGYGTTLEKTPSEEATFLPKPYTPKQLVAAVKERLQGD